MEWALHSAVLLAVIPPAGTIPGRALAEFHGVSETYLLKHMQALTRAGIFESAPGPLGGYRLAREPDQITLLDIVEAIEGTDSAFRCDEIRRRGPTALDPSTYTMPCGIYLAMLEAEEAWREALRSQTLADLLPRNARSMQIERRNKARAWIRRNLRLSVEDSEGGSDPRSTACRFDSRRDLVDDPMVEPATAPPAEPRVAPRNGPAAEPEVAEPEVAEPEVTVR